MLGVVIVSCIPLLVGLLGLCWPWLKWFFVKLKKTGNQHEYVKTCTEFEICSVQVFFVQL